jgi:hypothetical protein
MDSFPYSGDKTCQHVMENCCPIQLNKLRILNSTGKVMTAMFSDHKGILLIDLIQQGTVASVMT